jgi:hypothetical protein
MVGLSQHCTIETFQHQDFDSLGVEATIFVFWTEILMPYERFVMRCPACSSGLRGWLSVDGDQNRSGLAIQNIPRSTPSCQAIRDHCHFAYKPEAPCLLRKHMQAQTA